jgi:DNA-binding GntR family transcriptional regulator
MNDPDSDDRAPLAIDEWPYDQVADRIDKRIRACEFGEHGKLPGSPDLAEWCGVTMGVIAHAREELKRRRLVVVIPGHGTFTRATAGSTPGDRWPPGDTRQACPVVPCDTR